ncbi:CCA tRNA nucleotidyltransferase [Paracoccus jiaweipingae]|uniref:CCA tRNA nucleotidyltransferase n=1 Tax=unclassified Paracoccus (in: a-proteobacteria) TaxID=2688777 RepID=UPI0037AA4130
MTDRPAFLSSAGFTRLAGAFAQRGWRLWAVGGCVRDSLLGRRVGDIDLCSDALPQQVMQALGKDGFQVIPTGIDHGTVTVMADGTGFEVTTLRRDLATDGRHATVGFTTDLAEDAARRDFTMNALYMTPDGQVIDPLGGMTDLRAQRVRFVGAPDQRITEDYLRILRFFRFHAWYGRPGQADAAALAACARHRDGIATLSRERVGAEMRKLLAAPDPSGAVALMQGAGLLAAILPGADAPALAALIATEAAIDDRGDWPRRLAALLPDAPAPVTGLRLSRAEARHLNQLTRARQGGWSLDRIGYALPAPVARDAAILCGLAAGPGWREALVRAGQSTLPIAARDLPDLNGPALGAALRAAEDAWVMSGFTLTPADLCATARQTVSEARG